MTEGLIRLPSADTEMALPERLIDAAWHYMAEARSKRTREAYGRAWALFQSWCIINGRQGSSPLIGARSRPLSLTA
jgi:hypothetical protein